MNKIFWGALEQPLFNTQSCSVRRKKSPILSAHAPSALQLNFFKNHYTWFFFNDGKKFDL